MQSILYLKLNFYKGGGHMEILNTITINSSECDDLIRGKYIVKGIANLSKNADMDAIFKKANEAFNAISELQKMLVIR